MLNFQIARFIGGENEGAELEPDSEGWIVNSIEVGRIKADSGDKYECSPSPGSSAIANVQVITEGENSPESYNSTATLASLVVSHSTQ